MVDKIIFIWFEIGWVLMGYKLHGIERITSKTKTKKKPWNDFKGLTQ